MNEIKRGTTVISPNAVLSGNKIQIMELIQQIASQHQIEVEDAAIALQNALTRLTGGKQTGQF